MVDCVMPPQGRTTGSRSDNLEKISAHGVGPKTHGLCLVLFDQTLDTLRPSKQVSSEWSAP